MGKYWKWALLIILASIAGGIGTYNLKNVDWSELDYEKMLRPITYNPTEIGEISETVVLSSETRMRRKVRAAAVEVSTPMGRGSGTYFKIEDRHLVVTASHVVGGSAIVSVIGRGPNVVTSAVTM